MPREYDNSQLNFDPFEVRDQMQAGAYERPPPAQPATSSATEGLNFDPFEVRDQIQRRTSAPQTSTSRQDMNEWLGFDPFEVRNRMQGITPEKPKLPSEEVGLGEAVARGFLQAGTLGFADEAMAGIGAGIAKLAGIDDRSYSELYKEALTGVRKREKEVSEERPIASIAGTVAGIVPTAGATLARAGYKGIAGLGGVAGVGFSEEEEIGPILLDAVQSAGLSVGTAGLLNAVGKYVMSPIGAKIKEVIVKKGIKGLDEAERLIYDALGPKKAKQLLNRVKTVEKQTGGRLPLGEVADDSTLRAYQDVLAEFPEFKPQIVKAGKQAGTVAEGAKKKFFKFLSPDIEDVPNAAEEYIRGTAAIKDKIIQQQKKTAAPLYEKAFRRATVKKDPLGVQKPEEFYTIPIDDLRQFPEFQIYARQVAGNTNFQNLPANSAKFLHQVRSNISRDAESMRARGQLGADRASLVSLAEKIKSNITNNLPKDARKAYEAANRTFREGAETVESLFGKRKNTVLARSLKLAEDVPEKSIGQLFKLSPRELKSLKRSFAEQGESGAFEAATKGYLLDILENQPNIEKFLTKPEVRKRLQVVLGPQRFRGLQRITKFIDSQKNVEKLIATADEAIKLEAARGLRTKSMGLIRRKLNDFVAVFGSIIAQSPEAAAIFAARRKIAQDMRRIMGTPESLRDLTNYLFTHEGDAILKKLVKAGTIEQKNRAALALLSDIFAKNANKIIGPLPSGPAIRGAASAIGGGELATGETDIIRSLTE